MEANLKTNLGKYYEDNANQDTAKMAEGMRLTMHYSWGGDYHTFV